MKNFGEKKFSLVPRNVKGSNICVGVSQPFGPMFWIFGEIPEFLNIFIFGFPDRRRLEGVRSFVFWDRKRLEGVRKFWEWDEFAKYRDFPYIFPDLFKKNRKFSKFRSKNPDLF